MHLHYPNVIPLLCHNSIIITWHHDFNDIMLYHYQVISITFIIPLIYKRISISNITFHVWRWINGSFDCIFIVCLDIYFLFMSCVTLHINGYHLWLCLYDDVHQAHQLYMWHLWLVQCPNLYFYIFGCLLLMMSALLLLASVCWVCQKPICIWFWLFFLIFH